MMFNLQLFGGSGASLRPSPSAKARGGKLSLTLDDGSEVELKEDKDLKNASLAYNLTFTNPGERQTDGSKNYTYNCQRVVVAYELRRRGYRVAAKPITDFSGADPLPKAINPTTGAMRPGSVPAMFKGAQMVLANQLGSRSKTQHANIVKQMEKWGPGSRAVVQVWWSGSGGHIFNVENVKGKVVFIDAQVGKMGDAVSSYFDPKKRGLRPSGTVLLRTDNVKLSNLDKDTMNKAVRKARM